jgi:hypothetical protein
VVGQEFDAEISTHLEQAHIILLLVSPYFIASNYCYELEMKRAMERHQAGEAIVIPVILEYCDWHPLPFGKLLATPTDGKPISKFPNRHEALAEVAKSIRTAIESLKLSTSAATIQSNKPSEKSTVPQQPKSSNRTDIRSSNLRLKKTFEDYDKDQFLQEAFQYISLYFDNSLQELQARNTHIKTNFRPIDANSFEATIYADGKQRSRCGIRMDKGRFSSIVYTNGGISPNIYGQMLSVIDDGYSLFLDSKTNQFHRQDPNKQLSFEGGAELFWTFLIDPLQNE